MTDVIVSSVTIVKVLVLHSSDFLGTFVWKASEF